MSSNPSKKRSLKLSAQLLAVVILAVTHAPVEAQAGSYKPHLVSRDLNGRDLNGKVLDGLQVSSVSMDNVMLDGDTLSSVWLQRSRFHGITVDGKQIKARKFVGAVFEATLSDGESLQIRIDAMELIKDKPNKQVFRYLVSYSGEDSPEPLCGYTEDGSPMYAIPINSRWNLAEGEPGGGARIDEDGVFTFACEEYVLAKCVLAGYKPWKTVKVCSPGQGCEKILLAGHHQACTRLLKADYCGDGNSYTQNNTWVSLYDGIGIRIDSDDWLQEAEWNAEGAVCMDLSRLPDVLPPCFDFLHSEECGNPEHFSGGTLLISEIEPDGE